jgi:hypothetical protein
MTGGGLATARRDAAARRRELRRSDRRRQEVTVSATALATDGSPPTKNATELAGGRSACAVMNDHGSSVVEFDRETAERRVWLRDLRSAGRERLRRTRRALYKAQHDARRKLRRHLDEHGLSVDALLNEA